MEPPCCFFDIDIGVDHGLRDGAPLQLLATVLGSIERMLVQLAEDRRPKLRVVGWTVSWDVPKPGVLRVATNCLKPSEADEARLVISRLLDVLEGRAQV